MQANQCPPQDAFARLIHFCGGTCTECSSMEVTNTSGISKRIYFFPYAALMTLELSTTIDIKRQEFYHVYNYFVMN